MLYNDKLEYDTEVNCETNCSAKPKSHVFHPWPMSRPPRPHQRAPHSNDPTERPPAPSKGHHRAWDASKIVVAPFSAGLLYRSSQWQPVSVLMQKIIVEPPLSFNMQPILSGQLDTSLTRKTATMAVWKLPCKKGMKNQWKSAGYHQFFYRPLPRPFLPPFRPPPSSRKADGFKQGTG